MKQNPYESPTQTELKIPPSSGGRDGHLPSPKVKTRTSRKISRTRKLVIAASVVQVVVSLILIAFMSMSSSPSKATIAGTFGLLVVGCLTLLTQYNNFGIGFVLAGNYILVFFWTKGLIQHVPRYYSERGLHWVVILSVILMLGAAVPCGVNAYAIPKLAANRNDQDASGFL